jgi:hypothetical protein
MPWIKAVKNILDSCGFSNIVSKFEKPQISQPYKIGLTILSKRSY